MDLQRLSKEELEYELNDVNQKLSDLAVARKRGNSIPQKKFNSYIAYKRDILREMRKRAK